MSNDHVALSRRGFLKGTLATAGVALAGASHAGDIPAEWAKPKCSNWSWEKPMEKIPADQIKKTVDTDVVVIGAGLTGFSAALFGSSAVSFLPQPIRPNKSTAESNPASIHFM